MVKLVKINPIEYKKAPKLALTYGTYLTKFGKALIAVNNKRLCFLTFFDNEAPMDALQKVWPNSSFHCDNNLISRLAAKWFEDDKELEICLKGTNFQLQVWETLMNIKKGSTLSYEGVAIAMGNPKAVRAAAGAVANNNVAYFVPCHRVIAKNGSLHKYGGGPHRKAKMLAEEGAL